LRILRRLASQLLHPALAEFDAVRARFGRTIKLTAVAAGTMLAAVILGLLGATGFGVAAGLALAIVMPGWAAALVVAGLLVVLAAAAGAAAMRAFRMASRSRPAPTELGRKGHKQARPTKKPAREV
jgi:hypothetical protein